MLLTLLAAFLFSPDQVEPRPLRILFLGNSHTAYNDLSGTVAGLLRSTGAKVEYRTMTGGLLDDLEPRQDVRQEVSSGRYTHVVLQGAKISSSHKYTYSQAAGIALATRASKAGSEVVFFAEWPRRGWNESEYIYGHYETIRSNSAGQIAPVPFAWDAALKRDPRLGLWANDGNHASPVGSYLAASTIAHWISGPDSRVSFRPRGIAVQTASFLDAVAAGTVRTHRKKT